MPDPTNFIGQCIRYQIDVGQAAAPNPGALVPKPGQTTVANVTIGPDPRNLGVGTPWMFTWLKYCAGEVTTCALAGGVLTGPMSGCYLFRYTSAGGNSVAHVGTDNTPESAGTIRAKAIWNAMMAVPGSNAVGDSPTKTINQNDQVRIAQGIPGGGLPSLCGYFEGQNAWAVLFAPAVAGVTKIPGVLRIAEARRLPLVNWLAVKAMREWR